MRMHKNILGGGHLLGNNSRVARRHRCAGVGRPQISASAPRVVAASASLALTLLIGAMIFPALPEGAHAEEPTTATPRVIEEPTVSLSVPATIEFDDVMATPDGATTTASAEIGVTTTASAGYKLYVYAEDNTLKSLNPQTRQTIVATTQTSAVEELANNTWGYNLSEGTTAGTAFAELPISDATPAAEKDTSATSGATGDIYTLALGAKVDSTMPSGTYTATMTVAAVAEPAGVVVTYDANGGYFNGDTSWTSDPIAYTVVEGSDPTPSSEVMTPTRPGYVFWGWYKDAAGSWKNEFEVTPSVQSGTVYAKWLLDVGPIQNYTSATTHFGRLKPTRRGNLYDSYGGLNFRKQLRGRKSTRRRAFQWRKRYRHGLLVQLLCCIGWRSL